MRKTVNIGGRDVVLDNNASMLYKYRQEFGGDVFADFNAMIGEMGRPMTATVGETVMRLTYIMAKNADKNLPPFEDWLEEMGTFPITTMPAVVYEMMCDTFEMHSEKNSPSPKAQAEGEN